MPITKHLIFLACMLIHAEAVDQNNDRLGKMQENNCNPNWRKTRREFKRIMKNEWKNPDCYDFTLKRTAFGLEEEMGPFDVQVRDGVIVSQTGNSKYYQVPTMNEIFKLVRDQCFAGCPQEGAAKCSVTYGPLGNVESLYIDQDSRIIDEEISYDITNFKVCSDPFGPEEKCDTNWKQTRGEFKRIMKNEWKNPDCYNFTFKRTAFGLKEDMGPFDVQVRDGIIVSQTGNSNFQVPTMKQILKLVRNQCFAGCPQDGAAECSVTYGPQGNVESLWIDQDFKKADEEIDYEITNFKVCDAPEDKCDPNWKKTRREFQRNIRKTWKDPDCYDFTFKQSCFCTKESTRPYDVKVRDGVVVSQTGKSKYFQVPTMKEILELVREQCFVGCPQEGAAECSVTYGPQGNVESLYIDQDFRIADEEISYQITNFTVCEA